MMKERNWEELGQELADLIGETTAQTAVEVKIGNESLDLFPAKENDGHCFFHMPQVVDFCRCKRLSNLVSIDSMTGYVVCHIF